MRSGEESGEAVDVWPSLGGECLRGTDETDVHDDDADRPALGRRDDLAGEGAGLEMAVGRSSMYAAGCARNDWSVDVGADQAEKSNVSRLDNELSTGIPAR